MSKITLMGARDIALDRLVASDANVRRIKAGVNVEELAKDIARRGLLQSLNMRPLLDEDGNETGTFAVTAGGRRLAALKFLVKQKRLARNAPVPCIVKADGIAQEDSLAENVMREAQASSSRSRGIWRRTMPPSFRSFRPTKPCSIAASPRSRPKNGATFSATLTPREYVLDYLSHSFPTQLFEVYSDDNGDLQSRPVIDENGPPVRSREALERRDRLIEHLAALPAVQGALDQIVQRFASRRRHAMA